jgi:hypothetical protein
MRLVISDHPGWLSLQQPTSAPLEVYALIRTRER